MKQNIILFLSLLFAVFLQYRLFSFITHDTTIQFVAGLNLAEGKGGIVLPQIDANDWAKVQYIPEGDWPAGMAVVTALFHLVIKDYILSINIQSLLFTFIFFAFLLLSLLKLKLPTKHIAIALLFLGLCSHPFQMVGVSGLAALSFFMMGIYFCFSWIEKEKLEENISIFYLSLIGFVLFLPSFFRFAYYPSGFSLIAAYLVYKITNKGQINIKNIFIVSLSLVVFTLLQIYYQHTLETVNFLENREEFKRDTFIYIKNLKLATPIALETLVNYQFLLARFGISIFNDNKNLGFFIFHILSFLIFLFYAFLFKKAWLKENTSLRAILLLLLIPAIINFCFMLALSLYYPAWNNDNRTFLTLSRYLAPVSLFLIIFTVLILSKSQKWFRICFYLLLTFNVLLTLSSFHHYGISKKQEFPSYAFPLLSTLKYTVDVDKYKVFLSNLNLRKHLFPLQKPNLAIGHLEPYLQQVEKEGYYTSRNIKVLVIYKSLNKLEMETRLKNAFGVGNVKEVLQKQDDISIWEIDLLANVK